MPANHTNTDKLSPVEKAKRSSDNLRGKIAQRLAQHDAQNFEGDDTTLLKFHGIYQQDDRDARIERRIQGLDKAWSFMIRVCVPGGIATADQYLKLDELVNTHANGSLRLTTRQAFQIHGVVMGNLKDTMAKINHTLLTSLNACGDVPRNVMAPPAPYKDPVHTEVRQLAVELANDLRPATGAYHEIWLDGERLYNSDEEEPFYGPAYLPRKFKLGVAIDTDNSIDLYAYDAGFVAVTQQQPDGSRTITGYNLLVGGGLGMTHNKPDTIARMASVLGSLAHEQCLEAMRTVVSIYRDHGNRDSRRHARIKYLIEEWGEQRFIDEFNKRASFDLAPPLDTPTPTQLDHLGLKDQGDGKRFLGVFIPNGRIKDFPNDGSRWGGVNFKTAFRHIVEKHTPGVIITPMQSLIFSDLTQQQADDAIDILKQNNIPLVEDLPYAVRYSMACVALPTCGLALAESERIHPDIIDDIHEELEELGLADLELTIRMTGCPNGCARPYNADIGLVGRKPGVYHIYVGGGLAGDRLADLFATDVPVDKFRQTLRPLFQKFKAQRNIGESLSDYYQRLKGNTDQRRNILTGKEEPTAPKLSLEVVQ